MRTLVAPDASPEEAAAIAAALERFLADGAAAAAGAARVAQPPADGWLRAARREAVAREPVAPLRDPWLDR